MPEEKIERFNIKDALNRKNIDIGIVILSFVMGIYLGWDTINAVIFAIFIWIIINPIPSRYLAYPALLFLSITPFLLILDKKDKAEEFAIYAYYFLAMTVIMGIYEIRKEDNNSKLKDNHQ